MSNIHGYAKTSGIGRAGQGTNVGAAATLDGALVTSDMAYLLSLNGDIYVANGGTGTAAATFAGAFDADGPDLVIDVPANTTIVPLFLQVQFEAVGTTLLLETFASISATLGAVSAGTAVTPANLRTGDSGTSACTVNVAVDAAGCTAQTGTKYEFFRGGFELAEAMAATEDWQERKFIWSAKETGIYPIINGAGSLFVHASSQAGTGFITAIYYEVETANI